MARRRIKFRMRRKYQYGGRGGRKPVNKASSFVRFGALGEWGAYKLRGITTIQSSGTGTILNTFRTTQPDNFDGAATALTDWTSVANLYDSYRVYAIRLNYYPAVPNDVSATAKFAPVYVFTDFDTIGANPTNASCVGYGNVKTVNMNYPWKYYIRIPKMLNSGSSNISMPGWMDTVTPVVTGGVYMVNSSAGQLSNNVTYGYVKATYYLKVHNRK